MGNVFTEEKREHIFCLLMNALQGEPEGDLFSCKRCGSERITKGGKNKTGKQRYRCKACGCSFSPSSGSLFPKSHLSKEQLREYIKVFLKGETLAVCKEVCGVGYQTAFEWRGRLLNILRGYPEDSIASEVVSWYEAREHGKKRIVCISTTSLLTWSLRFLPQMKPLWLWDAARHPFEGPLGASVSP